MNKYADRIEALRSLMRSRNWDAVIIGGSDPHQSEYPARRWKQVEWLTGFTGEAGDVVVTLSHAGLWTDTRYFIQAVEQLEGTGVVLHKTRVPEQVLIPEWLRLELGDDAVIALDSLCISAADADALGENFTVMGVPDMLSMLWEDRPGIPQTPIFRIRCGESREEKMEWLRGELAESGCDAILLSSLDEIAWMLNVRASDIEYNPMVISYLLVGADSAKWFVLKEEVEDSRTEETFEALQGDGIELCRYDEISLELSLFEGRIWLDSRTVNHELCRSLRCAVVCAPSPVASRKEMKNPYEIENMRECHVRDGVAMEKFLYWLEKSVAAGKRVTEWDASVKLGKLRAEIDDYQGDSFETISAYGPGAALPHYLTPQGEDAPLIEPHGLYLNDSGGQYLSGTTDITRTVPMGECTPLEIEDYTLVLKAHIDLAAAVFPAGTPGCRIDAAARLPLWKTLRNFGHGTGHGVGFFLGVHEGPHQIRQNLDGTPMLEGMISSNEPGLYREGKHGIRHENLVLCVDAGSNEFGSFLKFETITMCHLDTSVVDLTLLDKWEVEWLNDYNRTVFETIGPMLEEEEREWLRVKTLPIGLE